MPEIRPFTSVRILRTACQLWFKKNHPQSRLWFASQGTRSPRPRAGLDEVVDVVLFGDFLDLLERAHCWPRNKYRLWVLSEACRDVCVKILGLRPEQVGVIPRYELFPAPRKTRSLPSKSQEWTLVFSGRVRTGRNVDLCLRVTSLLQTRYGERVRLAVVGSFRTEDHRQRFWFYYHALPWKIPPLLHQATDTSSWLKHLFRSPVLIALSEYFYEDFGVSVSQAQHAGWPCIVSDWGGHRDVSGRNVIKIPPRLMGKDQEPAATRSIRAEAVALEIHQQLQKHRREAHAEPRVTQTDSVTPVPSPMGPADIRRMHAQFQRLRKAHRELPTLMLLPEYEGCFSGSPGDSAHRTLIFVQEDAALKSAELFKWIPRRRTDPGSAEIVAIRKVGDLKRWVSRIRFASTVVLILDEPLLAQATPRIKKNLSRGAKLKVLRGA